MFFVNVLREGAGETVPLKRNSYFERRPHRKTGLESNSRNWAADHNVGHRQTLGELPGAITRHEFLSPPRKARDFVTSNTASSSSTVLLRRAKGQSCAPCADTPRMCTSCGPPTRRSTDGRTARSAPGRVPAPAGASGREPHPRPTPHSPPTTSRMPVTGGTSSVPSARSSSRPG